MTISTARYFRTLETLNTFVNRSLELAPKVSTLSGFHYNRDLLKASAANTYLETVGNRANSIHLAIKKVPVSDIIWEYRKTVEVVGTRFKLDEQDVVLAFDYTDENFHGNTQGMWIHGYMGAHGVAGKFKFLTCAIVSSDIPQKIPLISVPVQLGHDMAKTVCWCLTLVEPLARSIKLILFDREFYSKDLMLTLANSNYSYLIFIPKNPQVKRELENMAESEKKRIQYQFKVNKKKTVFRGEAT